jgi:hypothetical protein
MAASVEEVCILATLPETGKVWLAGFVVMDFDESKRRREAVLSKGAPAPLLPQKSYLS